MKKDKQQMINYIVEMLQKESPEKIHEETVINSV